MGAKRQHFVSRAYLERWAVGGNVLVRRRDGAVFEANPINVAVEAGMYDMPTPEGGKSSVIEDALADVESVAIHAIREIDATGRPPTAGADARIALSVYLALQMTRTPESRERAGFSAAVVDYLAGRKLTHDLMAEYLERVHLHSTPTAAEVDGAYTIVAVAMRDPDLLTPAATMSLMLGSVQDLFPIIGVMNWAIESDRKGRLITSDSPVVIWRTPSPEDAYRGIGLVTAEEVRFPLDPTKQLTLSHQSRAVTSRMSGPRVRACNGDVAAGSHQFVVGRPDQRAAIESLRLGEHRPVLRFNVAPGFQVGPDGKQTRMEGDIVHSWVPRSDAVPVPVRRSRRRVRTR